jgi:hypothetical protein
MTDSRRLSTKRPVTLTTGALQRSVQYLTRVHDSLDDRQHLYLLDWDLLQEAIYPDKASSVYSALVWFALDCLESSSRGDDWKPILPEGTRRELLHHLANLTGNASQALADQRIARSSEARERLIGTLPPEWQRPDWREVLGYLQQLYRANEAMHLLLLVISRYTRPCQPLNEEDLAEEKRLYEKRLSRFRRKASNSADAQNLATAVLLSPSDATGNARVRATLVTGSRTVWQAGDRKTADPFLFMVDAYYRRYQPDRHVRKKQLRSLISDLYKLLAEVDHVPEGQDENLMREETPGFFAGLDALDNVALQELGRLLSTATQAVANARALAEQLATDELPGDFSGIANLSALKRRAQVIRDAVSSHDTSDLDWQETFSSSQAKRYRLWAGGADLLDLQIAEGDITLSWPTRRLMSDFLDTFREFAREFHFPEVWRLGVRVPRVPGVRESPIQSERVSISDIRRLSDGRKVVFARLDAESVVLWYLLVNRERLTHGRGSNHHARIAIRLPGTDSLAAAISFFEATGYEWYFPDAVQAKVRERLEMF